MTDTEKDALCARIDELCAELGKAQLSLDMWHDRAEDMRNRLLAKQAENAKLREQLERLQPTDCEGNVLDIADTVHMLRSEYDGDHEWEDVVTELVLTKWGGDRWIVRGSKGEAWACDCAKTGYDEDAYEASDDVEPFGEPTLLEAENAKLRELGRRRELVIVDYRAEVAKLREFASEAFSMAFSFYHGAGTAEDLRELTVEYRELEIEVDA